MPSVSSITPPGKGCHHHYCCVVVPLSCPFHADGVVLQLLSDLELQMIPPADSQSFSLRSYSFFDIPSCYLSVMQDLKLLSDNNVTLWYFWEVVSADPVYSWLGSILLYVCMCVEGELHCSPTGWNPGHLLCRARKSVPVACSSSYPALPSIQLQLWEWQTVIATMRVRKYLLLFLPQFGEIFDPLMYLFSLTFCSFYQNKISVNGSHVLTGALQLDRRLQRLVWVQLHIHVFLLYGTSAVLSMTWNKVATSSKHLTVITDYSMKILLSWLSAALRRLKP